MAAYAGPQPRAAHLTDDITSRCLYGTVRGACKGCSDCGRYIIKTKENYTSKHQATKGTQIHPDNDLSITYCSRCGCPPDAHEIIVWETERELGADAYSLHQWDSAIVHYTRAIDLHQTDATLWTNRAASYLAKGWHAQALHDAEHAVSLRPEWFRPWARKGAALLGLNKLEQALIAYQKALECANHDNTVNEATMSGIQSALRDAEKKFHLVSVKKKRAAAPKSTLPVADPPRNSNTNDRRETVDPRTPAYTEEVKTELSSSFSIGGRSAASTQSREIEGKEENIILSNPSLLDKSLDSINNIPPPPSSWIPTIQQQMFAQVQAQYTVVVKQVELLKDLMDKLHEQMLLHDNNIQQQQEHEEGVTIDGKVSSGRSSRHSRTRSEVTEDGALCDLNSGSEEEEDLNTPSSPILKRKLTTEIIENATVGTEDDGDDEIEQQKRQPRRQHEDFLDDPEIKTSLGNSNSSSRSSSDNEFDAEFEWLGSVQAARKQLLGVDETNEYGFVPPPPASFAASLSSRRQPKNTAQPAEEATSSRNTDTTGSILNNNIYKHDTSTSKLDLGSLQSLLVLAAARQRRKDPFGIEKYACKTCGPGRCAQYENKSTKMFGPQQIQKNYPQNEQHLSPSQQSMLQGRRCSRCGCDCTAHETEEEATSREAAEQQAKERQERIKQQREDRRQRHHQPPPSPETERIKRVVAAAARKAAAEEAGEPLQCTDCDVLTQSKRGTCISCKACSGFKIYYSSTDANNPEIMLYCSICGCTAESHPVDSSWEQKESARREAENAAAARAAARARHSFNVQATASAAARKEEADAYDVLGLHYGADSTAVTRAYKRLALKLHPDKLIHTTRRNNGGDEGGEGEGGDEVAKAAAHAAFVKVTQAYKLLSNLKS
ncbi:hypothetical protein Ndes2526B_g06626 [Nannochloris sp. 'desiccata']